jgi:hypothetical protein
MQLIFQFYSGKLKSAAVTNSLAANFVFSLGAHMPFPSQSDETSGDVLSSRTKFHLRKLFWVCYTIDKELSFRIRQPPTICDEYCDLTVSASFLERLSCDFAIGVPQESIHPCRVFPSDIKLSQIKSRAYKLLYSAVAIRKTDAQLLMSIRQLDDELETWRIAIPHKYRPNLSFSHETQVNQENLDIRALIVRLEYHHCVTVIHQATGRCAGRGTSSNGTMNGINTSTALAVEASRSSLRYLQITHHILDRGSFWQVTLMPTYIMPRCQFLFLLYKYIIIY